MQTMIRFLPLKFITSIKMDSISFFVDLKTASDSIAFGFSI